ncbi:hypothetical protein CR513_20107, partial [Mucuna pruriens]
MKKPFVSYHFYSNSGTSSQEWGKHAHMIILLALGNKGVTVNVGSGGIIVIDEVLLSVERQIGHVGECSKRTTRGFVTTHSVC